MSRYMQVIVLTFLILLPTIVWSADYSSVLKNKRLIRKGCGNCGIEFKGKETLLAYAEMGGLFPVAEYRIRWIASNLFLAIEKEQVREGCPPRVDLYKIERMSGKKIVIRLYSTGWTNSKDDVDEYNISPPQYY